MRPPRFFSMANAPRFQTEDIERLFRALLPSGREDPFGKIEEFLIVISEELQKDGVLHDEFREKTLDQLDSIESRTFGILLLQIFKTISFFFRLLPQGRLIILVIAIIALIQSILSDGQPSLEAIKAAAKATGLSGFVDKIIEELKKFTDEIAGNMSEIADVASVTFAQLSFDLDFILNSSKRLEFLLEEVNRHNNALNADQVFFSLQAVEQELAQVVRRGILGSNLANNAADLIGPILRGLDDQIKTIPALAIKAIRLG